MKKIIKLLSLTIILSLFLITFVSAVCTVTFGEDSYAPTETITAEMSCSGNEEKNTAYTLIWRNDSNDEIPSANDSGTTPSTAGENFYESYSIPSGYSSNISAELIGSLLEGIDEANVTGASATSLIISNSSFGGGYIGLVGSIQAIVKDDNNKKISGGVCKVSAWSNDETQILLSQDTIIVDGEVKVADILPTNRFDEGTGYAYKILCMCGSDGGAYECIDEDGVSIEDSVGSTKGSFTTKEWITVNTITDNSLYVPKQEIFICANLTNVEYHRRIPVHIYHRVRCSQGTDNNDDTDRILIISDDHDPDNRGVSSGTTQNQCKRFVIPQVPFLEGRTSECYASTGVWVIDDEGHERIGYQTTSPMFSYFSNSLNLEAWWNKIDDYTINAVIDLGANIYSNYNATSTSGSIDIRLNDLNPSSIKHDEQYGGTSTNIITWISSLNIKNISAVNESGDTVFTVIQYNEDGLIELQIGDSDVDITPDGWYNVTLNFHNFGERQSAALEGINNSAGTFDFNIVAHNTKESTTQVVGKGLTGKGNVLNRDLNIKCQVDGYPGTYTEFKVFCTNSFSFSEHLKVPFTNGIYTMRCTAIDSFFGEDAVQAVANFEVNSGNINYAGAVSEVIYEIEEEESINETISDDNILKEKFKEGFTLTNSIIIVCILIAAYIGIWVIVFLLYKRKKGKDK